MKSMKLLTSDRTIVGIAILHKECNQFHKSAPPINQESVLSINQESSSLSINTDFIAKESLSDNNLVKPLIIVGYTFTEWCDAEQYINAYAIKQRFATRLARTDRNLGLIVRADIVCHHAGTASNKSTELQTTRSVATANLEYNHLLDSTVVVFDLGHQKLSSHKKTQVQVLHNSGIPIPTIVNMLTEEYSQYIHSKDVYNVLTCQARDHIKGLLQVAELLNNLQNKKDGVDAMRITFLIASGLISNETILSFCWVLQQLKQVVDDITINKIQTILTDKDLAMLSFIRNELSHVKHQLCIWHLEQNIVKNLTGKLGNRFLAFSKDFKITMMQNTEKMFKTSWNYLLVEYPEVESYMNEQWKPLSYAWEYCFTNKNTNYGIRTTQQSEASNAYLKHLLGYTVPFPELINALDKLSCQQLQHSEYQQYHIRGSTLQQCPELLKTFQLFCNYTTQFSLPCHHIIALYLASQKEITINHIGEHWIVNTSEKTQQIISTINFISTVDSVLPASTVDLTINSASSADSTSTVDLTIDSVSTANFISSTNSTSTIDLTINSVSTTNFASTTNLVLTTTNSASTTNLISTNNSVSIINNQQVSKNTIDLLKEVETICNRADPATITTKGRPSSTKRQKTGAKHAIKKKIEQMALNYAASTYRNREIPTKENHQRPCENEKGKPHDDNRWRKEIICYNCGEARHITQKCLYLRYRGQMVEVPISHSSNRNLQDPTQGDNKSKSRETFSKFTYENKDLLETENAESPAIYLTVVEDTPTQDPGPSKCSINEYLEEFAQTKELNDQ
ncbi:6243_t:CDS:2 [Cetraspora pellucida]|uniref:6243_t:CDS:1 n=1 Tax=Cetraspora pellucida TaxID=1433469 RepID=A0A9N9B651_9GLOM|nr:6243_t:CDS:2 [Cetraspora pellucida]